MAYVLNRLLSILLTLFLISVITFAVTSILPGDVATMIMGTQSNLRRWRACANRSASTIP